MEHKKVIIYVENLFSVSQLNSYQWNQFREKKLETCYQVSFVTLNSCSGMVLLLGFSYLKKLRQTPLNLDCKRIYFWSITVSFTSLSTRPQINYHLEKPADSGIITLWYCCRIFHQNYNYIYSLRRDLYHVLNIYLFSSSMFLNNLEILVIYLRVLQNDQSVMIIINVSSKAILRKTFESVELSDVRGLPSKLHIP